MNKTFSVFLLFISFSLFSIPPENLTKHTEAKTANGSNLWQGKKLKKAIEKRGITFDQLGLAGADTKEKLKIKPTDALTLLDEEPQQSQKPAKLPPYIIDKYRERALAAREHVKKNKAYKAQLNGVKFELPIGIKKEIGNAEYTIIIDSVKVTPLYAYVVAYMLIEDPKNANDIYFLGKDIRFSRQGGFTGEARLELMKDYTINLGDAADITFKVDPSFNKETYVTFDCDGFKHLHLEADILFNDMFVPEDIYGNPKEGNIKAEFSTDVYDWNNWMIEIPSIEKFQIEGLEGISFKLTDIAYDKSDYENPAMVFPEGYLDQMAGEMEASWEGFYAGEIMVTLPPSFEKNDSGERISFSARDMIIDRYGFSGSIRADNIFNINEGNLDSWSYSLDYFELTFAHNNLQAGAFGGTLLLPISQENHVFSYNSIIVPDESFNFQIITNDEIQFPLFGAANVALYENSSVEITVANGKFKPKAELSGKMSIGASVNGAEEGVNDKGDGSGSMNLAEIGFQRLILKTDAPYLSLHPEGGAVSFGSEALTQNMGKFPITILHIEFQSRTNNEVALEFGIRVNLAKGEDSGFAGEADVAIVGELKSENGRTSWKYKTAQLNRILVDVKNGGFELFGEIYFFRSDPIYGNGFGGRIKATFQPGITIQSSVMFGNKPEIDDGGTPYQMRYWFVDGMLTLAPSMAIPISAGVAINGFGGGAYYHMTMDPTGKGMETTSGLSYVPDKRTFLGVRASIQICGYPTATICKGEVNFEITFLEGGGLGKIAFYGMATLMVLEVPGLDGLAEKMQSSAGEMAAEGEGKASIIPTTPEGSAAMKAKLNAKADGAIGASWLIVWDNENNSLHSDLEILINVSGVFRGVKGGNPYNVAGQMVMHFEPGYWYVHAGTPSSPNAVDALGLVTLESYFMMGHNLEPFAPLPEGVEGVLTEMPESMITSGSGVAFGSRVDINTGKKKFLIFYAEFNAGFGFDIMVIKFNPPAYCEGQSSPAGVNSWYAMGRAYAYVRGSMGLEAKVFGKARKLEIGYITASVSMGAKLPNPSYAVGAINVQYRLLGGMIKGKANFRLSIGRECKFTGLSEVASVKVISSLYPREGQDEVSVFNKPMAALNVPLEEEFEVIDNDGNKKYYRAMIEHVAVYEGERSIPGHYYLNEKKDEIYFKADKVFPEHTKLKFKVKLKFERKRGCCDWHKISDDDAEEKETYFTTGPEPDKISNENIFYSYPMVDMRNLYRDQYGRGYIKMSTLQDKALTLEPNFKFEVRYFKGDEMIYSSNEIKINNDPHAKRHFEYNLPTALLEAGQNYTLKIVKTPINQVTTSEVEENYEEMDQVNTTYSFDSDDLFNEEELEASNVSIDGEGVENEGTQIRNRTISGEVKTIPDKLIVEYGFHTSKYSLWEDKINTYVNSNRLWYYTSSGHGIDLTLDKGDELWEYSELTSTYMDGKKLHPAVRGIATNYERMTLGMQPYSRYLNATIYTAENLSEITREVDENQPIPVDEISLDRRGRSYYLDFAVSKTVLSDYLEVRDGAISDLNKKIYTNASFDVRTIHRRTGIKYYFKVSKEKILEEINKYANQLVEQKYEPMPNGVYLVQLGYYLPGEEKPEAMKMVNFDFKDREKFEQTLAGIVDASIASERAKRQQFLEERGMLVDAPKKPSSYFLKFALFRRSYENKLKIYENTPWWKK